MDTIKRFVGDVVSVAAWAAFVAALFAGGVHAP